MLVPRDRLDAVPGAMTRVLDTVCRLRGHRWTPWERPLRLVETCRCARCGTTRTRRLGLV